VKTVEYPIKLVNSQSFAHYGGVLESEEEAGFEVLFKEEAEIGWRLALSIIRNKLVDKLSRHPNTVEYFGPIKGTALICVAHSEKPKEIEVFLLDKPVYIFKNIWHATFTLSEQAVLSICENLYVDSEEYKLERPLQLVMKGEV
jgi:ureidoglycolate hydrolase